MPVDYYPQKTMEELQALLEGLQNRQLKGTITEFSGAGVKTVREVQGGNARLDVEIKRVLYSLHVRAQGTEEASKWVNPYAGMIRRTRARYTFS